VRELDGEFLQTNLKDV